MKLTLTVSELTAIVRHHYALPELTIEIEGLNAIPVSHAITADNLIADLHHTNCFDVNNNIALDHKIAAIKILREMVCNSAPNTQCGLAQAKWAIEDWHRFIKYVRQNGFPKMGTNDNKNWS
jgi:ribosomal protein L7/L12